MPGNRGHAMPLFIDGVWSPKTCLTVDLSATVEWGGMYGDMSRAVEQLHLSSQSQIHSQTPCTLVWGTRVR